MLLAQLNIGLPVAPLTEPAAGGFRRGAGAGQRAGRRGAGVRVAAADRGRRRHRDPPVRRRPAARQHERVDLGRGARRLRLLRPAPGDHGAAAGVLRADARGRSRCCGGPRTPDASTRPSPGWSTCARTAPHRTPSRSAPRSPRPTASRCAATTAGSARPDRPGPAPHGGRGCKAARVQMTFDGEDERAYFARRDELCTRFAEWAQHEQQRRRRRGRRRAAPGLEMGLRGRQARSLGRRRRRGVPARMVPAQARVAARADRRHPRLGRGVRRLPRARGPARPGLFAVDGPPGLRGPRRRGSTARWPIRPTSGWRSRCSAASTTPIRRAARTARPAHRHLPRRGAGPARRRGAGGGRPGPGPDRATRSRRRSPRPGCSARSAGSPPRVRRARAALTAKGNLRLADARRLTAELETGEAPDTPAPHARLGDRAAVPDAGWSTRPSRQARCAALRGRLVAVARFADRSDRDAYERRSARRWRSASAARCPGRGRRHRRTTATSPSRCSPSCSTRATAGRRWTTSPSGSARCSARSRSLAEIVGGTAIDHQLGRLADLGLVTLAADDVAMLTAAGRCGRRGARHRGRHRGRVPRRPGDRRRRRAGHLAADARRGRRASPTSRHGRAAHPSGAGELVAAALDDDHGPADVLGLLELAGSAARPRRRAGRNGASRGQPHGRW